MWLFWILLMVAVAGYFIYRTDKKLKEKFEDKFNPHEWELPPSVELKTTPTPQPIAPALVQVSRGYERKNSVLSDAQRPLFKLLHQALANEYFLLANVKANEMLQPRNGGYATQLPANQITTKNIDFVLCDNEQVRAVCAIFLRSNVDVQLSKSCEDANLPLVVFDHAVEYSLADVKEKILQALGASVLQPSPTLESALEINHVPEQQREENAQQKKDGGVALATCPVCSGVMLKRKAKTGTSAGKLFWICSQYPKCRGVLPIQ